MKYRIHNFKELASTNDTASESQYRDGDIIVAQYQSAGRGQRGNKWVSIAGGENLMFTLVLEPKTIKVNQQFLISITAALSVARTIESFGVEGVEVKWPNDIMVGGLKIAGILIEHSFMSEFLSRTIIGIGLNVAQMDFPSDAGSPTSLHLLGVREVNSQDVLKRFQEEFDRCYNMDQEELLNSYLQRLYRRDGEHLYEDKDGRFMAKIDSINPHTGLLTLKDSDNNLREYYFKEVSYC